ncbi:hypothetical protein ACSAZK_02735 [Methanosarcina sp. Mfa9]|uniref:hypothetical protein n=1 Tax=Methanosarcina sp. Mfa9 TaxID=3439063 RepID=UPI003F845B9B
MDPETRIENRDFSRQMNRDFNFLDDRADSGVVDKTLQDIDIFREKYSIDRFILDEDLEARLQKLEIQVESSGERWNK